MRLDSLNTITTRYWDYCLYFGRWMHVLGATRVLACTQDAELEDGVSGQPIPRGGESYYRPESPPWRAPTSTGICRCIRSVGAEYGLISCEENLSSLQHTITVSVGRPPRATWPSDRRSGNPHGWHHRHLPLGCRVYSRRRWRPERSPRSVQLPHLTPILHRTGPFFGESMVAG